MKRSEMKRTPSAKQRKRIADRKRTREQLLSEATGCAVRLLNGPGSCWGRLTHHHVIPASRGGSDGIENAVAVCQSCNVALSQDAEMMRWGYENGLLKHSWGVRGDSDGDVSQS